MRGPARNIVDDVDRGAAADHAAHLLVPGRDGAVDDAHEVARIRVCCRVERRLGLMTGGRKDRFVIVERDQVEDQIVDGGMRGTPFLKLQPDDRRLLPAFDGLKELLGGDRTETDRRRRHRTKTNEFPA
jgi:hypothetical protein